MSKKECDLFNAVYREISERIGLDAAIEIYQMYKGQQVSFPVHLFDSRKISTIIISEYNGSNIRMLARKYGYSEKTIRRIIKESLKEE